MKSLIDILHKENCSLVVFNGEIRTYNKRGIADLLNLLKSDSEFLQDSKIADKIIGKAAAALIILGRVNSVETDMISIYAEQLFERYNVMVNAKAVVPYILNRQRTGMCPLEELCLKKDDVNEILSLIENFVKEKVGSF